MIPRAQDTLTLLLPPDDLINWISRVVALKIERGDFVPEQHTRWLYRVQMLRLGLPRPEVLSLEDEDWEALAELVVE